MQCHMSVDCKVLMVFVWLPWEHFVDDLDCIRVFCKSFIVHKNVMLHWLCQCGTTECPVLVV